MGWYAFINMVCGDYMWRDKTVWGLWEQNKDVESVKNVTKCLNEGLRVGTKMLIIKNWEKIIDK